jgi:4-alpha-glucanotransferase
MALDDVLGVLDQVNIPGTIDQHPNWRRKMPQMLEELGGNDSLRCVADVFARAGRSWR